MSGWRTWPWARFLLTKPNLVAHPTNRKWVITPVVNGIIISRVNPLLTGVITHLHPFTKWVVRHQEGKWTLKERVKQMRGWSMLVMPVIPLDRFGCHCPSSDSGHPGDPLRKPINWRHLRVDWARFSEIQDTSGYSIRVYCIHLYFTSCFPQTMRFKHRGCCKILEPSIACRRKAGN